MTIEMSPEAQNEWDSGIDSAFFDTRQIETKGELVTYYKQTYQREWKQRLVKDLLPFTQAKNSKNLERRFDKGQLDRGTSKKAAAEYKALGATLPPIKELKPGTQLRITITVWVVISKPPAIKKTFTRILSPARTRELFNSGKPDGMFAEYGINPENIYDMEDIDDLEMELI